MKYPNSGLGAFLDISGVCVNNGGIFANVNLKRFFAA